MFLRYTFFFLPQFCIDPSFPFIFVRLFFSHSLAPFMVYAFSCSISKNIFSCFSILALASIMTLGKRPNKKNSFFFASPVFIVV